MYEIHKIIAVAYVAYSFQSILDVINSNRFNIVKYVKTICSCEKCLSFWLTWAISLDLTFALLTSFTVFLMQSFIKTKL